MSHGVVCKYHYRENFRVWLTSVTVWLFFREGVAKCPCKCGSVSEIYILIIVYFSMFYINTWMENPSKYKHISKKDKEMHTNVQF